nr:hypothetical protein [Micromonospora sp. DSM 115978]
MRCGPTDIRVRTGQPEFPDDSHSIGVAYAATTRDGRPAAHIAVEITSSLLMTVSDTDATDVLLSVGLSLGMHPTSDPFTPIPPPGPVRWRIQLPGASPSGVYGPKRLTLLTPLCPIPPTWLDVVAANGSQCGLVLVSRLGMMGILDHFAAALTRAARDGRVIGTTAAVIP